MQVSIITATGNGVPSSNQASIGPARLPTPKRKVPITAEAELACCGNSMTTSASAFTQAGEDVLETLGFRQHHANAPAKRRPKCRIVAGTPGMLSQSFLFAVYDLCVLGQQIGFFTVQ